MEDFVTYKQAKLLKDLGFYWLTIHHYNVKTYKFYPNILYNYTLCYDNWNQYDNVISAPTLSQAQKWLYEKYDLWIEVTIKAKNDFTLCIVNNFGSIKFINDTEFVNLKTPEEALSAGIDIVIDCIRNEHFKKS